LSVGERGPEGKFCVGKVSKPKVRPMEASTVTLKLVEACEILDHRKVHCTICVFRMCCNERSAELTSKCCFHQSPPEESAAAIIDKKRPASGMKQEEKKKKTVSTEPKRPKAEKTKIKAGRLKAIPRNKKDTQDAMPADVVCQNARRSY